MAENWGNAFWQSYGAVDNTFTNRANREYKRQQMGLAEEEQEEVRRIRGLQQGVGEMLASPPAIPDDVSPTPAATPVGGGAPMISSPSDSTTIIAKNADNKLKRSRGEKIVEDQPDKNKLNDTATSFSYNSTRTWATYTQAAVAKALQTGDLEYAKAVKSWIDKQRHTGLLTYGAQAHDFLKNGQPKLAVEAAARAFSFIANGMNAVPIGTGKNAKGENIIKIQFMGEGNNDKLSKPVEFTASRLAEFIKKVKSPENFAKSDLIAKKTVAEIAKIEAQTGKTIAETEATKLKGAPERVARRDQKAIQDLALGAETLAGKQREGDPERVAQADALRQAQLAELQAKVDPSKLSTEQKQRMAALQKSISDNTRVLQQIAQGALELDPETVKRKQAKDAAELEKLMLEIAPERQQDLAAKRRADIASTEAGTAETLLDIGEKEYQADPGQRAIQEEGAQLGLTEQRQKVAAGERAADPKRLEVQDALQAGKLKEQGLGARKAEQEFAAGERAAMPDVLGREARGKEATIGLKKAQANLTKVKTLLEQKKLKGEKPFTTSERVSIQKAINTGIQEFKDKALTGGIGTSTDTPIQEALEKDHMLVGEITYALVEASPDLGINRSIREAAMLAYNLRAQKGRIPLKYHPADAKKPKGKRRIQAKLSNGVVITLPKKLNHHARLRIEKELRKKQQRTKTPSGG